MASTMSFARMVTFPPPFQNDFEDLAHELAEISEVSECGHEGLLWRVAGSRCGRWGLSPTLTGTSVRTHETVRSNTASDSGMTEVDPLNVATTTRMKSHATRARNSPRVTVSSD